MIGLWRRPNSSASHKMNAPVREPVRCHAGHASHIVRACSAEISARHGPHATV